MTDPWAVRYYKEKGQLLVKEFFEMPSTIGITEGEKKMFVKRLSWVRNKGLSLASERSKVLEHIKGEDNLYSIRIPSKPNNPRVLLCAVPRRRMLVLLHAFKEKNSSDYDKAVALAKTRRDNVLAAMK